MSNQLRLYLVERDDSAYYESDQGWVIVAPTEIRARELAQMRAQGDCDGKTDYWLTKAKVREIPGTPTATAEGISMGLAGTWD